MKNQGQNENKNNTFHSQEFIHFIAELIGPSPRQINKQGVTQKFQEDKNLKNFEKIM